MICELGLDDDAATYELRTIVPWGECPSVERFADIHSAIQRESAVERLLVEEGWSLDSFETTTVMR